MSLDLDKVWADVQKLTKPKLEELAQQNIKNLKEAYGEYIEDSNLADFDQLLKQAAEYEVQAITERDRDKAQQYAEAAESVLRQAKILAVAEKTAAGHEIGAIIERALLSVWNGFKEIGTGLIGVVVKGVATGVLGPVGGKLVDAAGEFLGDAVGSDDSPAA